MKKKIGIIGAGVVGTAIGVVLHDKGYEVTGVYDVKSESTKGLVERIGCTACQWPENVSRSADILFITTSDTAIEDVVYVLSKSRAFHAGQVVVHMSGSQSSEILDMAREFKAYVLSIHPLQSFAGVERAIENLPGSIFSIEGDREVYETGISLVTDLGGEYFFIDRYAKPLYHAGACVVSNYLVTVIGFGIKLLESVGIPREMASRALLPLIQGTVNNVSNVGIPQALTGPIARGDLKTVCKHLESMKGTIPDYIFLYSCLGLYTSQIALEKGGIDKEQAAQFQEVFREWLEQRLV